MPAVHGVPPSAQEPDRRHSEVRDFRSFDESDDHSPLTLCQISNDCARPHRGAQHLIDKAQSLSSDQLRTIRVATPSSMVAELLAPTITALRAGGENVYPILHEVDDQHVYEMMRAGEVDFALSSMTGSDSTLEQTPLFEDRPCIVFPDSHPLRESDVVDVADISHYALIRPPLNTAANSAIEQLQRSHNTEFEFGAETDRLMTMELLTREQLAILIVPAISARLISHSGLTFRPIDTQVGWRKCHLLQRQGAQQTPVATRVIAEVKQRAIRLLEEHAHLLRAS